MRWRLLVVISALVVGILATLGWLTTSLLFWRALVPQSDSQIAIGNAGPWPLQGVAEAISKRIVPGTPLSAITKWLYVKDGDQEQVVGLNHPINPPPGWQVEELGWITAISTPGSFQFTREQVPTLLGLLRDVALGNVAATQPTFLIQLPPPTGPLALVGKWQNNQFGFVFDTTTRDLPSRPIHFLDSTPGVLEVALPSSFLESIPVTSLSQIESDIISDLALTKARPSIINELQKFTSFGVIRNDNGHAAIGTVGTAVDADAFMNSVRQWVSLERGYLTPVERAFRLPDGTVGYEYVPSPGAGDGFSTAGTDGCAGSSIGTREIWMCRQGDVVTVGNTSDIAKVIRDRLVATYSTADVTGNWYLQLPAKYLTHISEVFALPENPAMTGIEIEGSGATGAGVAVF